jgi:hypothetical protein
MKYVTSQPDTGYFHWQTKLYVDNFKEQGVDPANIHAIFIYQDKPSHQVLKMKETLGINIHLFQDDRKDREYPASFKPYGIYRLLKEDPGFNQVDLLLNGFYGDPDPHRHVMLVHDSDIILNRPLEEHKLCHTQTVYMSDTCSYLDYRYVVSKGQEQAQALWDLVGVPESVVKDNLACSGGAQVVFKGTSTNFWYKVYIDSIKIYRLLQFFQKQKPVEHPLQIWTSEMWATLYNLWLFGYKTEILEQELSFLVGTDRLEDAKEKVFFHCAGVTSSDNNDFYKGAYINLDPLDNPFLTFAGIREDSATRLYTDAIIKARDNQPLNRI